MKINNVPFGWKKVKLKQLSTDGILNGVFNDPKKVGTGTPLINVIDLYQDKIDYDNLSCLDVTDKELEQYQVLKGDLLFTRSSLKLEGIARCNIVDNEHKKMVFDCHIMRIRPDQHIIKPYYLFAYCNTNMAKMQFMKNSKTTTMTTIDQNGLGDIDVFVPPIAEQEKIAEILGTWDRAIEELTGLIAEKKELKRGLMQRLLTGTQRLPGFTKPWKMVKLGEVADLYQPVTISAQELSETGFPVYGANGLIGYYEKYNHDTWQIMITCRGSTCGTVNRTYGKSWITGNAMVVNCDNHNVCKLFLYYNLLNQKFNSVISGSGQPQIVRGPLLKYPLCLPEDLAEQKAIADVLSKADSEIDLLNQRLDVLKEQKRGLMQKLLTGEVRVKVDVE